MLISKGDIFFREEKKNYNIVVADPIEGEAGEMGKPRNCCPIPSIRNIMK